MLAKHTAAARNEARLLELPQGQIDGDPAGVRPRRKPCRSESPAVGAWPTHWGCISKGSSRRNRPSTTGLAQALIRRFPTCRLLDAELFVCRLGSPRSSLGESGFFRQYRLRDAIGGFFQFWICVLHQVANREDHFVEEWFSLSQQASVSDGAADNFAEDIAPAFVRRLI